MSRAKTLVTRALASLAVGSAIAMGTATMIHCASQPDQNRFTLIFAPPYDQFKGTTTQVGPSVFLQKRCGTLDCHGQPGRPLRIYGQFGLRFPDDADNVPGGSGTTETEYLADFQAVIGLEPEQMSRVVADPTNNPPNTLTLVRKMRMEERHKGGQLVVPGDDGDTCVTSWLAGTTNYQACGTAAAVR
jgi:hypothetical protein